MRVISGTARGRRLEAPKNYDTRPTNDMVKESVFNIIQVKVPEAEALDLFCGTGQLGIEALSRGAKSCVFVDNSNEMLGITRRNLETTGFSDRATIVRSGAVEYLPRSGAFDIIFLDPPYDGDLLDKALKSIIEFDILRDSGIIVCESNAQREIPQLPDIYTRSRDYKYGKIKITIFTKNREDEKDDDRLLSGKL